VRIGISKNIFKSEDKIKKYVKEENIEIGSITEAFNFLKTGAE
jgi:CRISPR-associated protein Cst2